MSSRDSLVQPPRLARVLPLRSYPKPPRERRMVDRDPVVPPEAPSSQALPGPALDGAAVTRSFAAPAALLAEATRSPEPAAGDGARGHAPGATVGTRGDRSIGVGAARAGALPQLEIGSVVAGRYRVLLHLGTGGYATISLALFRGAARLHKLVVLKAPKRAPDEQRAKLREQLVAEARLAARMNHQHVVQVHELVEHGGLPVMVMEYLDGCSLATAFAAARHSGFDLTLRLSVLVKLLAGLHHAHELCDLSGRPLYVVHRDVSPENVLLTCDGQVKLIDFGIALVAGERSAAAVAGKIGYMAPEQVQGFSDRRADIFAAGVLLWELITLRRFWGKAALATVMRHLAEADLPQLDSLEAEMDAALAAICRRALAPDAGQRYPTALHMQADLDRVLRARAPIPTESALGNVVERSCGDVRLARQRQLHRVLAELEGRPSAAKAAPEP